MDQATLLLTLILLIIVVEYAVEQWLDWKNYNTIGLPLPDAIADLYAESEFEKAVNYNRTKGKYGFLSSFYSLFLAILVLSSGILGWFDGFLSNFISNEAFKTILFFGGLTLASDILSLPFQYYNTFVIEEKFGFNKITRILWLKDKVKGYVLSLIIGGGMIWVLIHLLLWLGSSYWVFFWLIIIIFSIVMNMFYASWILPLFNKLSPLEEGTLKDAIMEYAQKVGFPLSNIYVIDGSKRSNKANAFFSGMGKRKKIVLYDTLISQHTNEELLAILAHEVGHYKKRHIYSGFIVSTLQTGLMLYISSLVLFNELLSQALGATEMSLAVNLIAFALLYSPISSLLGLLMNALSRKHEFEADAFAAKTSNAQDLISALKKLSVYHLSHLMPHPWYVFYHYSHPPLMQRIQALEKSVE
jgi:STE24 endopeptidase